MAQRRCVSPRAARWWSRAIHVGMSGWSFSWSPIYLAALASVFPSALSQNVATERYNSGRRGLDLLSKCFMCRADGDCLLCCSVEVCIFGPVHQWDHPHFLCLIKCLQIFLFYLPHPPSPFKIKKIRPWRGLGNVSRTENCADDFCEVMWINGWLLMAISVCDFWEAVWMLLAACEGCMNVAGCLWRLCECCWLLVETVWMLLAACGGCVNVAGCLWRLCECCWLLVETVWMLLAACGDCVNVAGCLWRLCECCWQLVETVWMLLAACGDCVNVAGCLWRLNVAGCLWRLCECCWLFVKDECVTVEQTWVIAWHMQDKTNEVAQLMNCRSSMHLPGATCRCSISTTVSSPTSSLSTCGPCRKECMISSTLSAFPVGCCVCVGGGGGGDRPVTEWML